MSGINPNDMVNRLTQQGAKQTASTFGAMSKKTDDKQKLEKQSYDINKQYQILDKHSQTKELEQNAKHSGLISQSLTNKELEEESVMFDEEFLIEEGAKEQGLLTTKQDVSLEENEEIGIQTLSSTADKEKRIFNELASKVGVSAEEIELAARQEVENQLATNKNEMNQLKFPTETSYIETEIYQDTKPAGTEIKEGKLIILDNNPIDIEIAEKEF
ncbi:MAG: hypothetical protein RMJ36_01220 [Candidatus Calescibacterium sp.]|nr:hypothetical protein [Candidatus Calescibacterium sp.]MDW8132261.1 hypothetical protein [Candidatus Calescibacterium sp.]